MIAAILFWILLASSLVVFVGFGQYLERIFALILLQATILTFAFNYMIGLDEAWGFAFAIDIVILGIGFFVAMTSHKYWPLWFVGFQSNAVAAGIAHLLDPRGLGKIYGNTEALWAIPALLAVAVGVLLDFRARQLPAARPLA